MYVCETEMEKKNQSGGENRRQQVFAEFRTPQHPSRGTNNWGGASPMLARNIPKETLDQRYERLYTVRNRDEIFPVLGHYDEYDDDSSSLGGISSSRLFHNPSPRFRGAGFLFRLVRPRRKNNPAQAQAKLGKSKGKWKLPRWDPKTRWPQGWC